MPELDPPDWPAQPGTGRSVPYVPTVADIAVGDLRNKARAALAANATFMSIGAPTNAQVLAQTRLLTREVNAIIRLLVGGDLLDTTATDT